MVSKLIKSLLIITMLLLPHLVAAQTVGTLTTAKQAAGISFTPALTDNSVGYLSQIFGTVGTILHGTSGQMLGKLFYIFNMGIFLLAGVFLIYTIVMTVIQTAHEGEFMGKKWNAAWIAIRTVLGLGLLVPSPTTGYSTIQVIVMWVVLQGVGFANSAWQYALNYLAEGGVLYNPPSTDTGSMVNLAGTILEAQVCMFKAQDVVQKQIDNQKKQSQSQGGTPIIAPIKSVTNFQPLFSYEQEGANIAKLVLKFPGNAYEKDGDQDNACGQFFIARRGGKDFNDAKNTIDSDDKVTTIRAALQQMILDLSPYAKKVAIPIQNGTEDIGSQVQSALVGAAADWINITLPLRTTGQSTGDAALVKYFQEAVQQGWIMAGRFYFDLGKVNQNVAAATSVNVTLEVLPAGFSQPQNPSPGTYISFDTKPPPAVDPQAMGALKWHNITAFTSDLQTKMQNAVAYIKNAADLAKTVDQSNQVHVDFPDAGLLDPVMQPVYAVINDIINTLAAALGDPIVVLQGIGVYFLATATTMWLGATVTLFGVGVGASVLSSINSIGYGYTDSILAFIPAFTVFVLGFFVLGVTFAYYVPLIPFIIFVFAVIGWLMSVIEAMVAAPLVALGITHPEGHDLLGKSEQAIMLLLSVFLRPVLMIIGLFAGMILSRVILRYFNSGFFSVIFTEATGITLFGFLGIFTLYGMLLITILNQVFSLIYVVPDRVMRWLGVSEQTTGVQEALQAAKGAFEQVGAGPKEIGGAVTKTAAKVGPKRAKALEEAEKMKKRTGAGPT